MLPKSPEQANTPTSQTGEIETQSQGDSCGTRVEFVFYFLNNTNTLSMCLMTNHVGISHISKLLGSSIQGAFGMLVYDRTKKICPNYHQEFC